MAQPMTTTEAAADLARSNPAAFAFARDPHYHADRFHWHLGQRLGRVVDGSLRRLMIFAPPQHGKSRLVEETVSLKLGLQPGTNVIAASYGADLAERISANVRDTLQTETFQRLFPGVTINRERRSRNLWKLASHSGQIRAAGVGGGLSGHPADLAVIDDPFPDWEAAQSPRERERVWNWYSSVLRARLSEHGAIVLIQTRWHPDDLAGRLMERERHLWTVLSYPALATDGDIMGRARGEPLAPARYSRRYLEELRETTPAIIWGALYDQDPQLPEGGILQPEQLRVLDAPPADVRQRVRAWDLAATPEGAAPDPDYTAGVLMARAATGPVIEDVQRGRWDPAEVERRIQRTAELDGTGVRIVLHEDPGQAGKAQAQHLARLLARYSVSTVRETGQKLTRALPFAGQLNAGNVAAVRGPWLHALVDELRAFRGDGSSHDDQVDAISSAYRKLYGGPAGVVAGSGHRDPATEAREVI